MEDEGEKNIKQCLVLQYYKPASSAHRCMIGLQPTLEELTFLSLTWILTPFKNTIWPSGGQQNNPLEGGPPGPKSLIILGAQGRKQPFGNALSSKSINLSEAL